MDEVETCVIFDAPFEDEPGFGVAFLEDEEAARATQQDLRDDGFRATVHGGHESPRRFWYLVTNAPLDELWGVLSCFFDAYIRFAVTPWGTFQVRESCGCPGCREPIGSDYHAFEECPDLEGERPGYGAGSASEFDPPIWN